MPMDNMKTMENRNLQLRLTQKPKNTILFDEIDWLDYKDEYIFDLLQGGTFFNKQDRGIIYQDFV